MRSKVSSGKRRPSCLGLNVLIGWIYDHYSCATYAMMTFSFNDQSRVSPPKTSDNADLKLILAYAELAQTILCMWNVYD